MKRFNFDQIKIGSIAAASVLALGLARPDWALAAVVAESGDAQPETQALSSEAPRVTQGAQASSGGSGESANAGAPGKMALEQVQAAMAAAEKKRQELLKPDPAVPADLAEQWGVEVQGVSRTAGGYMLDFRFRVVDAEKALPLFDHRIKPYVTAEKSGLKLPVPIAAKVGAFRPTNRGKNIKSDKNYYMIFANPDSYLKTGDKVSVVIGDFRVEHLTVN